MPTDEVEEKFNQVKRATRGCDKDCGILNVEETRNQSQKDKSNTNRSILVVSLVQVSLRTLELRAGDFPVSKSMFYSISLLKG